MSSKIPALATSIEQTIGNTPLVELKKIVPKNCASVYIKLENVNPTGSYKDRMARSIIEEAEKRGTLKPGMTVVECTAGGTGTALALVCSAKGYRFHVISSDAFSKEKLQAMRLFGAELELIASEGGKITPDLIPKMISKAEQLGAKEGNYWTQQFRNPDVLSGFSGMGKEILAQLDRPIDIFCAAVGSGGMVLGVSNELRKARPSTKIVVLEPASAPLITRGMKGSHKVDGIGVGFIPPFVEQLKYDEARTVEEEQARIMARRLAKEEGVFAGTSTGLNVVAAIEEGIKLGPGGTVVTVACDSGMKYLSSGLFD